jgi:hypothetical protein
MSDFFNIAGMIEYINRLKDFVDNTILMRKEKLNNLCECCKEKEIEIEWRPTNFCDEFYEDNVKKYKININFFCESCYNILLEREEIVPGEFTIFYKEKKEEI